MAAPAPPPPSLDYWRGFFNGARASIFDTIDAAIRVAAADCPDALRARRDAIAHPPLHRPPPAVRGACARDGGGRRAAAHAPRGVPVASPASAALMAPAVPHRRDGQDPVAAEVFLVKAALSSDQQMSEDELLEHLQRLQQLKLTVDTIKATEIGKAVKHLRKHSSKQIRQLVRSLIEGWQTIVTEWMSNEAAIVDIKTDAKAGEQQCPTNQESIKKELPVSQQYDPVQNWRLDQSAVRNSRLCGPSGGQTGQQSVTQAQDKPSNAAFGPGRPRMLHSEMIGSEMRPKQLQDISVPQTREGKTNY
ncbi:hypothetical protein ACQ4PT_015161 [Festuca glaucescens]